jgi:hypothetical protein
MRRVIFCFQLLTFHNKEVSSKAISVEIKRNNWGTTLFFLISGETDKNHQSQTKGGRERERERSQKIIT